MFRMAGQWFVNLFYCKGVGCCVVCSVCGGGVWGLEADVLHLNLGFGGSSKGSNAHLGQKPCDLGISRLSGPGHVLFNRSPHSAWPKCVAVRLFGCLVGWWLVGCLLGWLLAVRS